MSTVVVGFVDRAEGWAAVEAAVGEARLRQASVLVVHSGQCPPELRQQLTQRLEALSEEHTGGQLDWEVEILDVGNQPVEDLVAVVEEHAADLLVIGIRRRSSVGKFIMGSDAQRILMLAQCPVLAVKAPALAGRA